MILILNKNNIINETNATVEIYLETWRIENAPEKTLSFSKNNGSAEKAASTISVNTKRNIHFRSNNL